MSQIKCEYISHMGDALTVVNAARISFNSQKEVLDQKDEKLIKYLADHSHMSPFEHCVLSVKISCPLYIRSQIHRHRTFSYNEVSRRYTDKDMDFYIPQILRKQHESNRQASQGRLSEPEHQNMLNMIKINQHKSLAMYELLVESGVCKEQARGVLSQDLMTDFIMTGNLRNFAHFVKLRDHEGAQVEVQVIAKELKEILIDKFGFAAKVLFT